MKSKFGFSSVALLMIFSMLLTACSAGGGGTSGNLPAGAVAGTLRYRLVAEPGNT